MTAETKKIATSLHKVYKKVAASASCPLVLRPSQEGQPGKIIFKVAKVAEVAAVKQFVKDANQGSISAEKIFEDIDVYNDSGELIDCLAGKLLGYKITITV